MRAKLKLIPAILLILGTLAQPSLAETPERPAPAPIDYRRMSQEDLEQLASGGGLAQAQR